MPTFEEWLRTECFQKPTEEAYNLAKSAWKQAEAQKTPPVSPSSSSDLLVLQVRTLFKELDEKHHLAETEYLRTNSKFDQGRTAALAEVCSKLLIILNGQH